MSYGVWLECPSCHGRTEGTSWNYTSNIWPMLKDAGIDIHNWDNCLAKKILPELERGIANLHNEPERYKKMNPPNGWGNYNELLSYFLEPMAKAFSEYPDRVVRTYL